MSKYDYLIGIDAGTTTGVAVYDTTGKDFVRVDQVGIWQALNGTKQLHEKCSIFVYVEDARKIGGIRAKAQGAGSVKRDCNIWQEMLEAEQIPHSFIRPSFRNTKMNPETFYRLTGWEGKASTHKTWHHARDAAMLVWGR